MGKLTIDKIRMETIPLIIQNNNKFRLYTYKSEKELEDIVVQYATEIFGENSIYIDLKRKITSIKGISGVPDGFVLDFERKKLFIVEIELSSHDIIRHISNQLFRFKVAMNNLDLMNNLAQDFYEKILEDDSKKKITLSDIRNIIGKNFGIAIIIDSVSEQLVEIVNVLSQDGTDVLAIPFEAYIDEKNKQIFKFTTFTKTALENESKKWTFKWANVPIEKHLEKRSKSLENVFSLLNLKICSILGVSQKSRKNWVTYQTSPLKNFCTIKFLPDSLEINLKCNNQFQDQKGISRTIKRTPSWTFDRVFNIKSEDEIEYAMQLVMQAHICICYKNKNL